tara:strand:- start:990 stop:1763 length:774 start_codon:yes stop_codon:yes gene_type:complete
MLKKRIIFTLLFNENYFVLSRNFNLQKVGDINWLEKNYNFKETAKYIDELILLNISRKPEFFNDFISVLKKISSKVFVPISAGGGITSFDMVNEVIKSGADKVVMNSAFLLNKGLIKKIVNTYGSQSLIGSIDYKSNNNIEKIMIQNGKKEIKNDFKNYINFIIKNGVGEIYLNSIDRDGTGQGMDLNIINKYKKIFKIPTILVGGAGNANHFYDAILNKEINAVATANLYNFVGNGLKNARNILINKNIDLPKWEY